MRRGRRKFNPMLELIIAIRVAAAQIHVEPARRKARSDADAVPQTFVERWPNTVKGDLAKRARALMRSLPELPVGERNAAAMTLSEIAGVLAQKGGGVLVAEDRLDGKARRMRRAS
jgi:hypothetical protein